MTRNGLASLRALAPNSQGLTLIECLVAIIMVALVASAITPALVISVATRVQSQKAEQALQLAQSQIDQVRLLAEQNTLDLVNSTPGTSFVPVATGIKDNEVQTQPGPEAKTSVARDALADTTETFSIPLNGHDFAVQLYRTEGLERDDEPVAFAMGVRVYDQSAVESGSSGNLPTDPISLGVTGGEGQRSSRPLAALYTTVAVSVNNDGDSLCDLIQFTGSTTGSTASTPLGCTP
ncbi:MAG: type II secretion system protein [Leptolyngbyaceae cyanobacterium SM2_5_2]|nr:type II secretion system protein [Leptolyngbyaceae cyanobacterium SM2_5_2]